MSVSRSPIREALRQLASDGLVVEVPNKGVFVREFTAKDIEEIFEIRVLTENYAIDKICGHLSDDGARRLQDCMQHVEETFAKGDLSKYIEADTQLHDLIINSHHTATLSSGIRQTHLIDYPAAYFKNKSEEFSLKMF